jgi:hypothetical protein
MKFSLPLLSTYTVEKEAPPSLIANGELTAAVESSERLRLVPVIVRQLNVSTL